MKKYSKSISVYVFLFVAMLALLSFYTSQGTIQKKVYSDLTRDIKEDRVDKIKIQGSNNATIELKNGTKYEVEIPDVGQFLAYDDTKEGLKNNKFTLSYETPPQPPWWIAILPTVVLVVLFVFFWVYFLQQSQGGAGGGRVMSFGKSRARMNSEETKKVTFDDVAGADEEKEELKEIVEFLKHPKKFIELGARIPKGVLLVGPPGTGKTLLAKAVSGEAGVPFFSISGSDFVEMFVGVGASRVRDLFDQAKKNAPCIVFIDEIDAVGRHRGAGLGGGHDEREQTLNQLLVEMDGFGVNEGVIILAATNRPDILDPALLRPGRFDRRVVVGLPDIKGREQILKVHSKGKPLADDVKLEEIAKITPGFTGADIENLLNEAALLAARKDKKQIEMVEIKEASIKVIVGPEKKSKVINEKEKKLTAYHEAGHALAIKIASSTTTVNRISIIPSGMAGGYTANMPKEDKSFVSKNEMVEKIVELLGGRAAEQIVLGDISTGASKDLEQATNIARNMVTRYGMSEKLGPMTFGSDNEEVFLGRDFGHTRNYSEEVAAEIDREIKQIIEDAYKRVEHLLKENIGKLHKVAEALMEREKLEGFEFEEIFANA